MNPITVQAVRIDNRMVALPVDVATRLAERDEQIASLRRRVRALADVE